MLEPPSSVDRVLDVVQGENGLHDRGGPGRAAAQLGQDLQVLRVETARSPPARMRHGTGSRLSAAVITVAGTGAD
jgi:hypothetical protein